MNNKLKILHLEDLQLDVELVERELKKGNIQFSKLVVDNRFDFEKSLKEFCPDIILCDHSLASFNSIDALKIVRASGNDIPFILVTGTVSEEFAVDMMKEGISDYILKDRLQRLPQAVMKAMEKKNTEKERQKFLEQVIKNESLMKEAEHLAHFGSWQADLLNGQTTWSAEAYRILGYEPNEIEPTISGFLNYVHPDDLSFVKKVLALNNLPSLKLSFRIKDKNRQIKFIRSEIAVERNLEQKPIRVTGFIIDVTEVSNAEDEQKKAELELQSAYDKLLFHLENSPLGFIEWDHKLGMRSLSKRAEQIFGWSLQEFIASEKHGYSQVHEEDKLWVTKIGEQLLTGEVERNYVQHRNYTKDGKVIWCEWFNSALKDKNGKVITIMSLVQDITERKIAEQSLQMSQSNLVAIIENTDSTIYSLDRDFRYIIFNKSLHDTLQAIYGLDVKPGDNVFDFLEKLEPLEARGWEEVYSKALKGETVKFEKEFKINEFHSYTSFSIHPIWENQNVVGLSCFAIDITKQKQDELHKEKMSADLIQRNKNLEQFSYIVSHNLRMPVANIIGFTEVLKSGNLTKETEAELNEGLSVSVKKLDEVIKDLNNILQVKRDVNEIKELVKFSELADDIYLSIETLIEKEDAVIIWDFSEVGEMLTLKSYLTSIFYNLISNSLKYRRQGVSSSIEIKSLKADDKIVLVFKDNGMGIDLEKKGEQVFGLYKRFHTDKAEGKGMGLFMVKTQVETLGGKISISSEVNKGTEFRIEFEA